jgi:putative nucleotidyltransferase with HDIG domain
MGNPRTSMKDMGNVIGSDQAITSKLLRMVNSAYYGFPRRISTISQALVVIGIEGLRSLIMGLSVQPLFQSETGRLLWHHSIFTAAAAKIITQKYGNVHPEESFVVGLVHDIGRLVLNQHFPDEFEYFNLLYMDNNQAIDVEREVFGMDHGEIGARIANNWNLPPKIVESIKYHHKPNVAQQNQVVLIVCIADGLATYINALDNPEKYEQEADLSNFITPFYMERLNIKDIPEPMIEDIREKANDLKEVFDTK